MTYLPTNPSKIKNICLTSRPDFIGKAILLRIDCFWFWPSGETWLCGTSAGTIGIHKGRHAKIRQLDTQLIIKQNISL